MDECFRCGKDIESTLLFDVISNEGIKKICRECLSEENLPVLRKPEAPELSNTEKEEKQSVYQRLSKFAGIDPEKHSQKKEVPEEQIKKQEELRKLTNEKFREKPKHDKRPEGLKPYFHWALMRKRRLKKLSHKELAEKIREPEEALKMLEQGVVPEDYLGLIRKIEKSLEIDLLEKEFREKIESRLPEYIDFEKRDFDNLTIADLKELKKEKSQKTQEEGFEASESGELTEKDIEEFEPEEKSDKAKKASKLKNLKNIFKRKKSDSGSEENSDNNSSKDSSENSENSEEITQEEIDKLIYGKS